MLNPWITYKLLAIMPSVDAGTIPKIGHHLLKRRRWLDASVTPHADQTPSQTFSVTSLSDTSSNALRLVVIRNTSPTYLRHLSSHCYLSDISLTRLEPSLYRLLSFTYDFLHSCYLVDPFLISLVS